MTPCPPFHDGGCVGSDDGAVDCDGGAGDVAMGSCHQGSPLLSVFFGV